eukprot:CAMPEP_0116869586 /NCGR_PEP_ID=MMETSP0418-20121206/27840_1 /TAXON_ID=1158023 /ORGANISM="Astrosyne radiata, Strain 13vi08-1A" /LENGTH=146 /DNA_ID=CAMNT_0004505695 /DNA_START=79 /DNA_END=516 /DNA_ORIENTATION=+
MFGNTEQQQEQDEQQMNWIRQQVEQSRMAKNPLFAFCNDDPRQLSKLLLKRLVRGRASLICGIGQDNQEYKDTISYTANERISLRDGNADETTNDMDDDDASVKSTDSVEDPKHDNFTSQVVATHENGLRWITVMENEEWKEEFQP